MIERQPEHVRVEFAPDAADTVGQIRIFANTMAVTEFLPGLLAP